jgi:hypothetical protein
MIKQVIIRAKESAVAKFIIHYLPHIPLSICAASGAVGAVERLHRAVAAFSQERQRGFVSAEIAG